MVITFKQIQAAEYNRKAGCDEIFHLVGSAEDNANDTIYLENMLIRLPHTNAETY